MQRGLTSGSMQMTPESVFTVYTQLRVKKGGQAGDDLINYLYF